MSKPLFKRTRDLLGSAIGLVLLTPVMVAIALLIRMTMGAPVLFRQERPGLKGRPFTIFKFRTLSERRDAKGHLLPDEQRMTRLGSLLRRTSLDELPELLNVLKGDMSLVGPRPLLIRYLPRYTSEQMRRHDVLPGITGWAQVNGRNAIDWEHKLALDTWYVDHASFLLDLKILMLTAWEVLRRRGINQAGHATAEEFLGTNRQP